MSLSRLFIALALVFVPELELVRLDETRLSLSYSYLSATNGSTFVALLPARNKRNAINSNPKVTIAKWTISRSDTEQQLSTRDRECSGQPDHHPHNRHLSRTTILNTCVDRAPSAILIPHVFAVLLRTTRRRKYPPTPTSKPLAKTASSIAIIRSGASAASICSLIVLTECTGTSD
jgi:hypothetical protein